MFGGTGAFGSAGGAFGQQQQPGQQPGQQPAQQSLFGQPAGGGFGGRTGRACAAGRTQARSRRALVWPAAAAATAIRPTGKRGTGLRGEHHDAFRSRGILQYVFPPGSWGSVGLWSAGCATLTVRARPSVRPAPASSAELAGVVSNPLSVSYPVQRLAALTTPAFGAGAPSGGLFGAKPATTTFGFGAGATGQPSFGAALSCLYLKARQLPQALALQPPLDNPFRCRGRQRSPSNRTRKKRGTPLRRKPCLSSQSLRCNSTGIGRLKSFASWTTNRGERLRTRLAGSGKPKVSGLPPLARTSPNLARSELRLLQPPLPPTCLGKTKQEPRERLVQPHSAQRPPPPSERRQPAGLQRSLQVQVCLFGQTTTPAFGTSQPAPAFGSTAIAPTPFGAGFGTSANPAFGAAAQKPAFGFGEFVDSGGTDKRGRVWGVGGWGLEVGPLEGSS
ncbi:MAG: hypothetical protein BJ554DRAFT_2358 [Olpidium bornovanus]|uniref:Uncharacterized protein n=1 Tax=Olpidium bornovanus TaxID=278681 RepID=A0A8H7ZQY3_9FUNG|nr:MAG: hypothetical protein BJ554DRAFT_2358 [Olpidium bornovanus]